MGLTLFVLCLSERFRAAFPLRIIFLLDLLTRHFFYFISVGRPSHRLSGTQMLIPSILRSITLNICG